MLSNELKAQIQGAYSRFLEAKSLKPRYGQRLMIAEIAKVLGAIKTDDEGKRLGDPAYDLWDELDTLVALGCAKS